MISKAEYWKRLNRFQPTVYDAFPEAPTVKESFQSRAYCVGNLYYRIYSEIAHDVKPGAFVMDLGAYPGTFLRLCQEVFFPDFSLNLYGTGLILPEDEENFRNKANKCRGVSFLQSNQNYSDYFRSLGIPFREMNLDFCYNHQEDLSEGLGGRFDIVTCIEVIEHLHTPFRLMEVIYKLLKPGGLCILETNNVANLIGILKLLLTRHSNLDFELVERYEPGRYTTKHPHTRFYSLREFQHLLTKTGFVVEGAKSFSWSIPQRFRKRFDVPEAFRQFLLKLLPGKQSHILIKGRKPARG